MASLTIMGQITIDQYGLCPPRACSSSSQRALNLIIQSCRPISFLLIIEALQCSPSCPLLFHSRCIRPSFGKLIPSSPVVSVKFASLRIRTFKPLYDLPHVPFRILDGFDLPSHLFNSFLHHENQRLPRLMRSILIDQFCHVERQCFDVSNRCLPAHVRIIREIADQYEERGELASSERYQMRLRIQANSWMIRV